MHLYLSYLVDAFVVKKAGDFLVHTLAVVGGVGNAVIHDTMPRVDRRVLFLGGDGKLLVHLKNNSKSDTERKV